MSIGLFQEKSKEGGGLMIYIYIYTFLIKNLGIYIFLTLPLENKLTPGNSKTLSYTPWKFQDQKFKTNGKST